MAGTATVSCGANELSLEVFVGLSLASIRSQHAQMLNIPEDAVARVNGEDREGPYIVQVDDVVEFVKPSGSKG